MEAKDTVDGYMSIVMVLRKTYPEIMDTNIGLIEAIYFEGKQAGIKEVVDYFFYEVGIVALMGCSTMNECKAKLPNWQAKLKEWRKE